MTSMKVDEELWKTAKKAAIDEGITLQELLDEAVKVWVQTHQKKAGK